MIPDMELLKNITIVVLGVLLIVDSIWYPNKAVRTRTVINATFFITIVLN